MISDDLIDQINKLKSNNKEPKKITLGKGTFARLKFEVESQTNITIIKDYNCFCGIPISVTDKKTNFIEVS